MASCLRINIFSNNAQFKLLKSLLSVFPDVEFNQCEITGIHSFATGSTPRDMSLIWISNQSLDILWEMSNKGFQFATYNKNTIFPGADISIAQAVKLGQLGIQNVFDLDQDKNAFIQFTLKWYERQKVSAPTKTLKPGLMSEVIGDSEGILKLRKLVDQIADKERLTILLRGETGSGKGLIARTIHEKSSRRDHPFVEINCTAIPESLVEAELFGHEKGAFTDAHRSRKGIFELAHGGSLFLDEIGYLRKETQAKLLKVLEDKKFRRVGGEQDIEVDCRIIAGTSVDLEAGLKKGTFRADLYYRLNVFPIWIPPLRDRAEDKIKLAEYFRKKFELEHNVKTRGFSDSAYRFIETHSWPGNVRELMHTIERAVILSEGQTIASSALDSQMNRPGTPGDADLICISVPETGKSLEDIQREVISKVVEMTNGNKSEAARRLQISRARLLRKLSGS